MSYPVIPSPGYYSGDSYGEPNVPELLYSTNRFTQKGCTLAPGQGVLLQGTALFRDTDKLWHKATGAAVVSGFLRDSADTGSDAGGRSQQGNIVISGILKNDLVATANSVADTTALATKVNGRVDTTMNTFTF